MADSATLTDSEIKKASGLRIYFGHQSVGYNIIDGIKDVTADFNIVKSTEAPGENSFFLHSGVGKNTEPVTKINDFLEIVSELGKDIDVAFLKLCYIDFSAATDVQEVFTIYQTFVKELKEKYPDLIFVHFTAPLVTVQKGPKALVKKILGRSVGIGDNIQRQKYNELISDAYSGSEPVFDIARIESTRPDGSRVEHEKDGYTYYSLYEGYTDDGGHLNKTGRKIVAEKLIKLLSELN